MNCQDVRPLLPIHPDPDDPPATLKAVEDHLKACAACAGELRRVRSSWNLLEILPSPAPDPGFAARVRDRLLRRAGAPRLLHLPRVAAAAAAAILLAAVVYFAIPMRHPQTAPGSGAVSDISSAEIEIVQNLDLLQDFDIAETLDVLAADAPFDEADAVLDLLPREY